MSTIGDNIREERQKQELTQEQLAELSNISLNFISKLERNKRQNLTIKTLQAIAEALKVSPSKLLTTKPITQTRRIKIDQLSNKLYKMPLEVSEQLTTSFLQIVKATKDYKNKQ